MAIAIAMAMAMAMEIASVPVSKILGKNPDMKKRLQKS